MLMINDGKFTILVGIMYALLFLALFVYFLAKDNLRWFAYALSGVSLIFSAPYALAVIVTSGVPSDLMNIFVDDLIGLGSLFYVPLTISYLALRKCNASHGKHAKFLQIIFATQAIILLIFLSGVIGQINTTLSHSGNQLFNIWIWKK